MYKSNTFGTQDIFQQAILLEDLVPSYDVVTLYCNRAAILIASY